MTSTSTDTKTCGWYQCETGAPATEHRTLDDGREIDFCAEHAQHSDYIAAKKAQVTPDMLAEMRAERDLESRVS